MASIYEGAGNRFLCIDNRELKAEIPTTITEDGVLFLEPSEVADVRMRIFNQDGSEAAMCGNGLRCLKRFLEDLGVPKSPLTIETGAGVHTVRSLGDLIETDLGKPRVVGENKIDTGVPHLIRWVDNLEEIDVQGRGRPLRESEDANITFAQVLAPRALAIRTYERGVEGETPACGTGAAAAAYTYALKNTAWGKVFVTPTSGTPLEVNVSVERILLAGPAQLVYNP